MMRARLKGATRLLINDLGGLEASAALLKLSVSQLGRYQHIDADDFMTVASVAALEAHAGVRPHVTQALAAINGHILVPRPHADGDGKWVAHLASTVKETGEFLAVFGAALSDDGAVTAAEALRLIAEADQALSALMAVRTELERYAAREGAHLNEGGPSAVGEKAPPG